MFITLLRCFEYLELEPFDLELNAVRQLPFPQSNSYQISVATAPMNIFSQSYTAYYGCVSVLLYRSNTGKEAYRSLIVLEVKFKLHFIHVSCCYITALRATESANDSLLLGIYSIIHYIGNVIHPREIIGFFGDE